MATWFHDLPLRARALIFAAVCALIPAGAWQTVVRPARATLAVRQHRAETVHAELARVRAGTLAQDNLQRDLRAIETSLGRAIATLPHDAGPESVLRDLYDAARQSAQDVISFAPGVVTTRPGYSEWPVHVSLAGGYHDLARFFDRMGSMPRLMSVSDLHLTVNSKPNSRAVLVATFVATTFVFRREGEGGSVSSSLATVLAGYDAGGRRDPFVRPIVPGKDAPAARPAPGLGGVSLADVLVKGIVRGDEAVMAILEGPGGKSYLARGQDRLRDAVIKSIDLGGVVFVEQVADMSGALVWRDVRKALRSFTREGAR